jgi:hypothetical protein
MQSTSSIQQQVSASTSNTRNSKSPGDYSPGLF